MAVDGTVVSAAPIIRLDGTSDSFLAMLPPGLPDHPDRVIEIALVPAADDEATEVLALTAT